jgi:hypothetical protein
VSLGRALRRTVDMFHNARDLVEANDLRMEAEGDPAGEDETPE